jgi:hypothetical protein
MMLISLLYSEKLTTVLQKIISTLVVIYILTFYTHKYYADVKYWNVPSGYIEENGGKVNFFDIYYFQTTTWFTIGYGDFSPKHKDLKFITILNGIIAYGIALIQI